MHDIFSTTDFFTRKCTGSVLYYTQNNTSAEPLIHFLFTTSYMLYIYIYANVLSYFFISDKCIHENSTFNNTDEEAKPILYEYIL